MLQVQNLLEASGGKKKSKEHCSRTTLLSFSKIKYWRNRKWTTSTRPGCWDVSHFWESLGFFFETYGPIFIKVLIFVFILPYTITNFTIEDVSLNASICLAFHEWHNAKQIGEFLTYCVFNIFSMASVLNNLSRYIYILLNIYIYLDIYIYLLRLFSESSNLTFPPLSLILSLLFSAAPYLFSFQLLLWEVKSRLNMMDEAST